MLRVQRIDDSRLFVAKKASHDQEEKAYEPNLFLPDY